MARSVADVETLAPSWRLSLEAENKSPATITSYTYATTRVVAFLREKGMSNDVNAIAREHIEAFLVDVLERRSPATARARDRTFRQFFAWCEAEGEIIDADGADEATACPRAAGRCADRRGSAEAPCSP